MLGRTLRRTLIIAVAVFIAAAVIAFYLLSNPAPKTTFYRDRDGSVLADIRSSANILSIPLTRLTNSSISANLWVWRSGQWQQEREHIKKISWNSETGYGALIKVPAEKWKIELHSAPKRALKIADASTPLPHSTNLIFALEFPPRHEIEKSETLAPLPEEPPNPLEIRRD
jgi:hypothetical protein